MPDLAAVQLALWDRVRTLEVCTTGAATMAATATGYTRTAGSFLTDGFRLGMEVTPGGFTQTAPGVITDVTDDTMTIRGGRTPEDSGAFRSLVVGIPATLALENSPLTPTAGVPYLAEALIPGPQTLVGGHVTRGQRQYDGLYVLTWYHLAAVGIEALRACTTALEALFPPGWSMALGDGTTLRIRTAPAPFSGQALPIDGGWIAVTTTLPFRISSFNPA